MKSQFYLKMALLLYVLFICGSTNAQNLILWHPDGTTTEIELYTLPRIEFEGNRVLVTSTIINIEYDKNDVTRFTYKGKVTAQNSLKTDSGIEQRDEQIIIHDIKPSDFIAVYKTNGIRIPVQFSFQNNNAILSLSLIPTGVYLLCVKDWTSKFTKK